MSNHRLDANGRDPLDLGPFLRRREIAARTTLSIATLHELIKAGLFPPYEKLGPRAAGLFESQLDAWFESCMDARAGMRCLQDPVTLPRWKDRAPSGRNPAGIRILVRAEVLALLGVGMKTLYNWIQEASPPFPAPVPISERRRGWIAHEAQAWMQARRECLRQARRESIGDLVRRHLREGSLE